MPLILNRLKDKTVKDAKPGPDGKARFLNDGGGLYLRVRGGKTDAVGRYWLFRNTKNRQNPWKSIGPYPDKSLADAREEAKQLREQVREGVDPIVEARRQEAKGDENVPKTFAYAMEQYIKFHRAGWTSAKYATQWEKELRTYVIPVLGKLLVGSIDVDLVQKVIEPIWEKRHTIARRVLKRIGKILGFAMTKKWSPKGPNPAAWKDNMENLLPDMSNRIRVKPMPALDYKEAPAFVQALRQDYTDWVAAKALEYLILTAVRSNELLGARWQEIDWNDRVWTVPAERTKTRKKDHVVPLSSAAWAILMALKGDRTVDELKGFIFTSGRSDYLTIYDNGMRKVAQRIRPGTLDPITGKVRQIVTPHGFRSTFRDWAGDVDEESTDELAEHALSHAVGNTTKRAYRRGTALEKRRKLMERWADYCAGITPLRAAA
jgi:integrase